MMCTRTHLFVSPSPATWWSQGASREAGSGRLAGDSAAPPTSRRTSVSRTGVSQSFSSCAHMHGNTTRSGRRRKAAGFGYLAHGGLDPGLELDALWQGTAAALTVLLALRPRRRRGFGSGTLCFCGRCFSVISSCAQLHASWNRNRSYIYVGQTST
eukprot:COSAG05_NODE_590_length_8500_cov_9.363290_4_plen_156_part_00